MDHVVEMMDLVVEVALMMDLVVEVALMMDLVVEGMGLLGTGRVLTWPSGQYRLSQQPKLLPAAPSSEGQNLLTPKLSCVRSKLRKKSAARPKVGGN
jgi:hypothetical protein